MAEHCFSENILIKSWYTQDNPVSCYISAYMSVFKPIIQQVLEYYRPTVIVLQVSTVDNLGLRL